MIEEGFYGRKWNNKSIKTPIFGCFKVFFG